MSDKTNEERKETEDSTSSDTEDERRITVKSFVQKVDNKKPKKNISPRSSSESSQDSRSPRYKRRRRSSGHQQNFTSYYSAGCPDDAPSSSQRRKDENELKSSEKAMKPKKNIDLLTSKTGGAYIPPAKLRMLQAGITDKSSEAYQRISWEALKKSIHGYINKINVDNIGIVTRELLKENIVRGRGLLCRSIIQAQAASPTFTHVYAALASIINSKFPSIGELLLQRLVITFRRGFRRNDKTICVTASKFIAHLVNQRVAHEILALEILTLLVETPTDDSVEVAIAFLKECGQKLTEVSGKGVNAIFEMLKNILHEGRLEKRVQYMIEVIFQVRKDGFKDHVPVIEQLELVEEDDQFTHLIMLEEATETQDILSKQDNLV